MKMVVIATTIVWSLALASSPLQATIILETASPGPAPSGSFGTVLASYQFIGARFTLNQPMQIDSIGGHLRGTGTLFGAIVSLSSPTALPSGGPFAAGVVKATVVFNAPSPSAQMTIPLPVLLEPGSYALVYGSGLFGATGSGSLVRNNIDIPAQSSTLGWFESTPGSWRWNNLTDSAQTARRLVIEGHAVPEPSSVALVIAGLVTCAALGARQRGYLAFGFRGTGPVV